LAQPAVKPSSGAEPGTGFVRGLGLLDSTMVVAGAMIGSGIFIVSADIARLMGSGGWLILVWVFTGLLTIAGALTYGELAGMMPRSGGQYVFLRESYSPLFGFLYGWTLFLVIQTGTIAAVAVAFARFLGVLVPAVSPTSWIIPPINLTSSYAISLSWQQFIAIISIAVLTVINLNGLKLGKLIQNTFTSAKILTLLAVIVLGILVGRNAAAMANFRDIFTIRDPQQVTSDLSFMPPVSAAGGLFGLLVAFCVAQVGSLFSADAWHNIAFTAGEVKNPKRDIPLSLLFGTGIVITLYVLANVAYLATLPLADIQHAPDDRVGTALLNVIFGSAGAGIMAFAILISTFGCNNGLILAGARVYYAMAKDKLFFKGIGTLNKNHVPGMSLILQSAWACFLVLPRTRLKAPDGGPLLANGVEQYGNLYGNLLDYVVFSVLIFYILTVAAVFIMRRKRPDAERPYRAFGYPIVPALYILGAATIVVVLLLYRTQTTWPGLLIVLTGIPVYFLWHRRSSA
jgi:APA family basic amino acid/polyamine antiporter